ncbi:MAG: GIY-YIG nuclease family protein [bacterium]|nr:GIY-YIG nuclease family protein [bacterium]
MKEFYVYILTNVSNNVLYTGVTNNLRRRMYEHKNKLIPGFTSKYNLRKLVYFESFGSINDAIQNEKRIKGWLRSKKVALIDHLNPHWEDLSEDADPSLQAHRSG